MRTRRLVQARDCARPAHDVIQSVMIGQRARAFLESTCRVRCSKCLSELKHVRGEAVCPRCGQEGSVRLEDGSAAEFETGEKRGLPLGPLLGGLLLLVAGLAAAGWWWRAELAALLPERPEAVSGSVDLPDWRLARQGAFEGALEGGLIGIFGTQGDDRPGAFAALSGGELVTLLVTQTQEAGRPRGALVTLDGSQTLGLRAVALPDGFVGASLAPSADGGYYLALTGAGGVTLQAYGDGAAPLWERSVARATPPLRKAEVIAADGQVYLSGAAEGEGRLGIAAFSEDGALIWQRSFEATEDGRLFASLREAGGLFAAFETSVTETGTEVIALSLTASGETAAALSGLRIEGRLAGALPDAGGALVLGAGPVTTLHVFGADGAPSEALAVPEAALHDTLRLVRTGAGSVTVISAYRLSDIQTDLNLVRREGGAGALEPARFRLPPGIEVGGLALTGSSGFILAGRIGAAADADAFLLALDTDDAAPAGPAEAQSPAAAPVPAPARPAPVRPVASAGEVLAIIDPPADDVSPVGEARAEPASAAEPELSLCRFVCQDGESVFPLSKSVPAAEAADPGGLEALHTAACEVLGAVAVSEAAPVCTP